MTLDATNLQSDTLFTDIRNRRVVEKLLADPKRGPGAQTRKLVKGYAAGVNAYLRDIGGSRNITDPACRGVHHDRVAFLDAAHLGRLIAGRHHVGEQYRVVGRVRLEPTEGLMLAAQYQHTLVGSRQRPGSFQQDGRASLELLVRPLPVVVA